MTEHFSWCPGMSVDLITAPGDIRSTKIKNVEGARITIYQTTPPLDPSFRNRTILMTFSEGLEAVRSGCKAKVTEIIPDGASQSALVIIEQGAAIAACDLRKYPRFNPGLFDEVHILYDDSALEVTDISAGGVRGLYREGDLDHLTRGDVIRLTVGIGTQNHHVEAQVMRVNHAVARGGHWELAVAFMEWDRPLADALVRSTKSEPFL